MSDLAESLSRFTPDASGLDRDALLFAAGRASVRPARRWAVLAGALAASQLVTLALLVLQSTRTATPPTPAPAPFADRPVPPDEPPSPGREATSLWTLRDQSFATEGDLPSPRPVEPLAPSAPPLHAFAEPPAALLQ
jgi:hypothetical protein